MATHCQAGPREAMNSKLLPGPSVSRVTYWHPIHRKAIRQGKTRARLCVVRDLRCIWPATSQLL